MLEDIIIFFQMLISNKRTVGRCIAKVEKKCEFHISSQRHVHTILCPDVKYPYRTKGPIAMIILIQPH